MNTPSITPSRAAKSTRYSGGSMNVMVWAGIQNRGIVFLKRKPQIVAQSRLTKICWKWSLEK